MGRAGSRWVRPPPPPPPAAAGAGASGAAAPRGCACKAVVGKAAAVLAACRKRRSRHAADVIGCLGRLLRCFRHRFTSLDSCRSRTRSHAIPAGGVAGPELDWQALWAPGSPRNTGPAPRNDPMLRLFGHTYGVSNDSCCHREMETRPPRVAGESGQRSDDSGDGQSARRRKARAHSLLQTAQLTIRPGGEKQSGK